MNETEFEPVNCCGRHLCDALPGSSVRCPKCKRWAKVVRSEATTANEGGKVVNQ